MRRWQPKNPKGVAVAQLLAVVGAFMTIIVLVTMWFVLRGEDYPTLLKASTTVPASEGVVWKEGTLPETAWRATKRLEFGIAATLGRQQSETLFRNDTYGVWNHSACDPCRENCLERAAIGDTVGAFDKHRDDISAWGWPALQAQIDAMFSAWKTRGGFTMDHQVNLNSCAYKTRTRWNPHGVWLHISGRNVTTLRMMADGYRRAGHIKQYVSDVVARSPFTFDTPLVVYISVTDVPCNVLFPYLTFFMQRGVMGIGIPDDSFHRSVHGGSWEQSREELLQLPAVRAPFATREHKLFFRGSPTHLLREKLRSNLSTALPNFADMKLAVVERFKRTSVKITDHAKYRYLMAIRGKTASSRDKYLNLLGSAIVWATEDDEPWFQFYHVLWRPYINYIPMQASKALCVAKMLANRSNDVYSERIAQRSLDVGRFLTTPVVDRYMLEVLRQYAALQTYAVSPDPIAYMRDFHRLVRKRYRSALVMPDDQSPVKFFFDKWLSRRIKQMVACRTNNTFHGVVLPADSKYRCWYM